jgi:hypothetical protein
MKTNRTLIIVCALLSLACTRLDAQHRLNLKPCLNRPQCLSDWTLDGSGVWRISGGKLVIAKAGVPAGPIRRPAALAILKSNSFSDVTLQAEVRSTAPVDTAFRDLDLVFGYVSPSRFYYVHLAGITNDVHNGIFLVADANRRRIDAGTAPPQMKDQAWHRVRLERLSATGRIAVYVDGSKRAVMTAVDTTLRVGKVGFGSFDDTGEFRNILINGVAK